MCLLRCHVTLKAQQPRSRQRRPTRLTGPPRFIGVPGLTPTPAAPTPGVTTARATGRGRSTTPGLTTQPTGYSTYWQYTTALAGSGLPAKKPAMRVADNAIEDFMSTSFVQELINGVVHEMIVALMQINDVERGLGDKRLSSLSFE